MTSEQLQTVRVERWRHTANPLLTADDARAWLDTAGLCLFLPRRQQFLAPAPTFVEACAGAPSETPSREAIDNAATLMHRLVAEGAILPLNLFGTPAETPDFLVTREAFPYLFSLRGTREWKTVPAGKTSPLVIEIWKQLEKEGAQTAAEIQEALGRELTESAVLRGLMELWSNLRVLPEYEGSAPTRWSLTQLRFKDALNAAGNLSQTTALSALVSLYLETVIAATSEEVETFLSPLTSRSRVRETVNGLAATRQISMLPVGTQSMFHIAGALPEFAEPEPAAEPIGEAGTQAPDRPRQEDRAPRSFERRPFQRKTGDGKMGERKAGERKPFERKAGERKSFGRKAFERSAAGEGATKPEGASGKAEGERKPFGKRPGIGGKPFDKAARPFRRDARPSEGERPGRRERPVGGERPSFRRAAGSGGAGGKFPPKRFGSKPAGGKFAGRPGSSGRSGPSDRAARPARPWTPRPSEAEGPGRERRPPASGAGERSFRPREGAGQKRGGGFAAKGRFGAGKKFEGARSGRPKFGGKPGGAKFGTRRETPEGGKRPFFRKRAEGGPTESRPSGSRPPGSTQGGNRPARSGFSGSRPAGEGAAGETRTRPFSPRPSFGRSKPGEGSGPARRDATRSASGATRGGAWKGKPGGGSRFAKPGRSFSGAAPEGGEGPRPSRPAFGKPGGFPKPGKPGSSFKGKPGGGKGKSPGGGKKFGGPKSFGPRKPGGAKPPFRKRKDEGSKSAE